MAVIRQLKNFFTNKIIYPKTLTKAVYDEGGERLDKILRDTMLATDSEEYSGVEPRDADTLGGKYTKEDVEKLIEENNELRNSLDKLNSNLANVNNSLSDVNNNLTDVKQSLGELKTIYAPLNNVDVSLANPTVDFLVYLTDFRFVIVCATIKQGENYQRVQEIIPVDLIKYAPNTVFSVGKFLNSDYYAIEEFRFPNVHTINYINASYRGFDGICIDYIFAFK